MATMQPLGDPFTAYMEEHLPDLQDALEQHDDAFMQHTYDETGAIWCLQWHAVAPLRLDLWQSDLTAWQAEQARWYDTHAACADLLVWAETPPAELAQEILAFLDRHAVVLACESVLLLPGEQERDDAADRWREGLYDEEDARTDDRTYDEWHADYQADHPEIDWDAIEAFHKEHW